MKRILPILLLMCIMKGFSQNKKTVISPSKEDLVRFINSKMNLYNNGVEVPQFFLSSSVNNKQSIGCEIKSTLSQTSGTRQFLYLMLPNKATYFNYKRTVKNSYQLEFQFEDNGVLSSLIGLNDNKPDHTNKVEIILENIPETEIVKIGKAYKELIKKLGGKVLEDIY